jgi:hypothetical protein
MRDKGPRAGVLRVGEDDHADDLFDSTVSEKKRRDRLYGSDLIAFSAGETTTKLCGLARERGEAAFTWRGAARG